MAGHIAMSGVFRLEPREEGGTEALQPSLHDQQHGSGIIRPVLVFPNKHLFLGTRGCECSGLSTAGIRSAVVMCSHVITRD